MKYETGRVESVFYGKEDHGILTCSIGISFKGYSQSFGNLCLDEKTGPKFVAEMCRIFGVEDLNDIAGKTCMAGYVLGTWNEAIEVLKGTKGMFVMNDWMRLFNPNVPSVIERERQNLQHAVEWKQRDLDLAKERLAKFDAEYPIEEVSK